MNSDACILVCTALKRVGYISHSRAACRDKQRSCQNKLGNKLSKVTEDSKAGDAAVVLKCMCMRYVLVLER